MSKVKIKIKDLWYSVDLSSLPPDITLNTFIREHAQLTATKFMCLEGGCGSCVVTIKSKHPVTRKVRTWAANSCLTMLNSCLDWEITTCEGIGNKLKGYHPIQERMAKMNATQCGFCTPGFVMNMHSLLESKDYKVGMEEIENSFGGNICRCTGYRPILDAMKSFASDSNIKTPEDCSGDIEDIMMKRCPNSGEICSGICKNIIEELGYDDDIKWYWPKTLETLFFILAKIKPNQEYSLVAGNTAHGVYRRSEDIKHFIDINDIAELKTYSLSSNKLTLGANITLTECMDIFQKIAKMPGFSYCEQLRQHFSQIANVPVRNSGTLAGNIWIKKTYKEFYSDIFIAFEALNAKVIVAQTASERKVLSLLEFIDSKNPKSVILAFELPGIPKDKFIFKTYKVMPRAQNSAAMVNAAFLLNLDRSSGVVTEARLCYGGISPDFVHASAVEQLLQNKCFYDKEVVRKIFSLLPSTLKPNSVLPATSSEYRLMLACGLMLKFLLSNAPVELIKPEFISGGTELKRFLSSGVQIFDTQKKNYPVTKPLSKIEALIQCSGEATYTNDMLTTDNSVYCAFVHTTVVGATIEHIYSKEALSVPGVIAFYTAKDIPGLNSCVVPEFNYVIDEIFCSSVVSFYDQPLGVIVAKTSDIARLAAGKVKVIYSKCPLMVLPTMQDVLENNCVDRIVSHKTSENDKMQCNEVGNISGSGIFEIGLQYHYTMEPHTTIVVPFEQGLRVWTSTQCIDHTQTAIARMLNLKTADVQLTVRRLGGAYGCKITGGNRVACAASLAAFKLNRPVRFVEPMESMMSCVGKRWACRSDYKFNVQTNGKIVTLKNTFYEDAGCNLNQNPIQLFTIPTAKSCYALTSDNYDLFGSAVITDAPSSTFCRAPGSIEGISMIENIMEHIAFETGLDPAEVRKVNLQPGNKMNDLLHQFLTTREYKQRRQEIDKFNSKNRWIKRGIGLSIMEFSCIFLGPYTATVTIYHTDGSVVISHGGIEMGQGINTKVAQVAAFFFGIPVEKIKIEASDTVNGANCLESGASLTSESVCFAVRKACNVLNDRLKPIRDSLKKNAPWSEIVQTAWTKSVHLTASENCKVGDMKPYQVQGLALTEIQVDILTGNMVIKRVDILEDCGESLSPYVDVGQIEGSFVMGLGYWLTEKLIYDRETGQLLTNRSWTYKPPGAKDIPVDFRIEMLQGSANTEGFMRSKATGEPPCCLAVSVIFAIQHALQSARKDAGLPKAWVRLGAPTTPETIVLNSGSNISNFALK